MKNPGGAQTPRGMTNRLERLMTTEYWKPVVGYEGLYEVSDLGRVKSLERWTRCNRGKRKITEAILAPVSDKNGYRIVSLGAKLHKVHRLVMLAFGGAVPPWSSMVNHIDKNPSNNALSNLEWSNNSHNKRHANRRYTYKGSDYCLSELQELSGICLDRLYSRIHYLGWSVVKAVETPIQRRGS